MRACDFFERRIVCQHGFEQGVVIQQIHFTRTLPQRIIEVGHYFDECGLGQGIEQIEQEGLCREGELRAILLMAAMIASDGAKCWLQVSAEGRSALIKRWEFAVGSAASLRVRLCPFGFSVFCC